MKNAKHLDLTWISMSLILPATFVALSGCGKPDNDSRGSGPGTPRNTVVRPASIPGVDLIPSLFTPSRDGRGQPIVHRSLNLFCRYDGLRGLSTHLRPGQTWLVQKASRHSNMNLVVQEERIIEEVVSASDGPATAGSKLSLYLGYTPIDMGASSTIALRETWLFSGQSWQLQIDGIEQLISNPNGSPQRIAVLGSSPFCQGSEVSSINSSLGAPVTWEEGRVPVAQGLIVTAFRGVSSDRMTYVCANGSREEIIVSTTRLKTFDGFTPFPDSGCQGQDLNSQTEFRRPNGEIVLTETSNLLSVPALQ